MARVKGTTKKSTIERIFSRYCITVQAAYKISDRSVPNDSYKKRTIFYNSPDQIVETDSTKSFKLDSEKTESVEFTMSKSNIEATLSNSDEDKII